MRRLLTGWTSRDALILLTALTILPLLPNQPVDPWQVLNPRKLWLLGCLVMAIGAAGQMAQNWLGERTGLLLAGFAGGFVSSSATIAGLGLRARQQPALASVCAGGAVLSNVSTILQMGVVVGVLSTPLLLTLWPALVLAGCVIALFAVVAARASRVQATMQEASNATGRMLEPQRALLFMLIVAAVLLVSAWVQAWLGNAALDVALALSGLADVHAAAASAAQLVATGRITAEVALPGIALALASNSLVKLGLAWASGGRGYALHLLPGIAALVVAFWLALLWVR